MARNLFPAETTYLKTEIESGIPRRAKVALQQLNQLVRGGARIPPAAAPGMENALLGALASGTSDEKVRRWSLNALGLFGTPDACLPAIKRALIDYAHEPQVVAAAMAALFRMEPKAFAVLNKQGHFEPELIALSALQTVAASKLDLQGVAIDIDRAEPTILKLALVVVGLDRAPEHIFDPHYTNGQIVKVLGTHDEAIVSQYSAWAVAENPHLGLDDLGISVNEIDRHPPNVRSYVYRLFGSEGGGRAESRDVIEQGRIDDDPEARRGLATGLRDSWFDGLDQIMLKWWSEEQDDEVRDLVADHIVKQAHHSGAYHRFATITYTDAQQLPGVRSRMEAMAAGAPIYREFKRIAVDEDAGLFGADFGRTNVTNNNTFNVNHLQAGALSASGNATVEGNVQNALTIEEIAKAVAVLDEIVATAPTLSLDQNDKDKLTAVAAEAKASPSKGLLGKVVAVLKDVEAGLQSIGTAGDSVIKIVGWVTILAALA